MRQRSRGHLVRLCLTLGLLAATWASILALTGGVSFEVATTRVSSRNPRTPLLLSLAALCVAGFFAPAGRRWRTLSTEIESVLAQFARPLVRGQSGERRGALLAVALALAITLLGLSKGALVAGGADSYGYASQARLWARGILGLEQPLMNAVTWPFAAEALAPLGYLAPKAGTASVPVYPPGLPISMALFERAIGPAAVFYVVPLLAGLAVLATYMMGTRLAGPAAGSVAAILLASSPVFLFQLMFAMSDVPVAAWWAAVLALLPVATRRAAWAAGLAAGMTIMTRPNLLPLLAVPALYFAWSRRRTSSPNSPKARVPSRATWFFVGILPACLGLATVNYLWYGSPFSFGYGALDSYFAWAHLGPNLGRYPWWLLESQTPVVILGVAAPLLLTKSAPFPTDQVPPRTLALTCLFSIAIVVAFYLFYTPFDAWWYLRFLLPAIPPLCALTATGLIVATRRLPTYSRAALIIAVVVICVSHSLGYARERGVFTIGTEARQYQTVGEYLARRLPDHAVVLSMQQSGSARYYSNRVTLRYDRIPPRELDAVIADLGQLGRPMYVLLEDWEVESFRARFETSSVVGALDWPPAARHPGGVTLYEVADRMAPVDAPRRALEPMN